MSTRRRSARFPPTTMGSTTSGNVWEWTSDWYRHDHYQTLAAQGSLTRNPQGPADSVDPSELGVKKKVHKGGSFLCTDQYCARYIAGGRGKGEPDTGTNQVGFRLMRDMDKQKASHPEPLNEVAREE